MTIGPFHRLTGWRTFNLALDRQTKLEIRVVAIFFISVFLAGASPATGQTVSCSTYLTSYDDNAKLSFSYGYLEGVEAALTKDVVDLLVPPTHSNYPLRWLMPEGINSYKTFAEKQPFLASAHE